MRLANSSWSVFQPATSSVGSWPFAAGACVCVCICACTLIRPQDVNCNIPAHGPLAAPSGARSLWESDEILATCQPPGSRGSRSVYFVAASEQQVIKGVRTPLHLRTIKTSTSIIPFPISLYTPSIAPDKRSNPPKRRRK